jgi:hypothetical protein
MGNNLEETYKVAIRWSKIQILLKADTNNETKR